MKNLFLISVLSASLFSCSLLQRHISEEQASLQEEDAEPGEEGPLFDANGQELTGGTAARDSEVARLNTKIAALETKVDVLTANLERVQAQKSQPIIEAEQRPQASMAAPVEMAEEFSEPPQISAAPAKPVSPPVIAKSSGSGAAGGAEKDFRAGMQLFQNGQHLEAASSFALTAKKYPNHLLAGHALYWAGESNARGQQMGLAAENWLELEKRYPRSAYLPEALAGLAKAFEAQGESAKAAKYRSLVLQAFPKSPVALKMESSQPAVARSFPASKSASHAPAAEEEQAPEFESSDDALATDLENQ